MKPHDYILFAIIALGFSGLVISQVI